MSGARLIAAAFVVIGCRGEQQAQVVIDNDSSARGALRAAVEAFVKAGRTPTAYRVLADGLTGIAATNTNVVREAELRLVTLAIVPFESVLHAPMVEQAAALGLTVWPYLLGAPLSTKTAVSSLTPSIDESLDSYFARICRDAIEECKDSAPDHRGYVLATVAAERALRRTDQALDECAECGRDPAWHEIERRWEVVVRSTAARLAQISESP